jgi:hypothetical protein
MNSEEIAVRIKDSINELVIQYNRSPWSFTTESDVTNKLYSLLQGRLDSEDAVIHSELRPFLRMSQGKEPQYLVIKDRKEPQWIGQEKANGGAMIDIVVVDGEERFRKEALEKATREQRNKEIMKLRRKGIEPIEGSLKLRYWRMLSYPVKAFRAAIEVKIKVSGNVSKIKNDVKKLRKIRDENRECRLYLLVLDRMAASKKLEDLKGFAKSHDVTSFDHRSVSH